MTKTSQSRVPSGAPTGGQFSTAARTESDVSLTGEPGETVETPERSEAEQFVDLVGRVAAREFENARETYRPALREWAEALPGLSDRDFVGEAGMAIHGSSLVNSWRGNWDHEHFKASAAHHESNRRKAAGHDEDCEISTLYERAFNDVARSQGHGRLANGLRPCTCGSVDA